MSEITDFVEKLAIFMEKSEQHRAALTIVMEPLRALAAPPTTDEECVDRVGAVKAAAAALKNSKEFGLDALRREVALLANDVNENCLAYLENRK